MDSSDRSLVERIQQGDKEAFGTLFDKYANLVFKVASHYIRNRRDAMDIVQDVFLKAYRAIGEIRDYDKCKSWLCRIALHTSLNWQRAQKNMPVAIGDAMDVAEITQDATTSSASTFCNKKVWAAINELNDEWRAIVMLKYMDNMSYAQIAEVLGVSMATVRNKMYRAKSRLKEILGSQISSEIRSESASA